MCPWDSQFQNPKLNTDGIDRIFQFQRPRVNMIYRQVSNIRRTKSQHLKDSRSVLRLSLPNPLKPDVKSGMKM